MSLLYVGDCTFAETKDSGRFSIDPWGMDVLTRVREGRNDELEEELALYDRKRDLRDATYKDFYFVDLDTQNGRSFTKVVVTYKGLKGGKIPAPSLADSGTRRNTIELSIAEDIGFTVLGASTTITYDSPWVKVNFVSDKKQKFPRFRKFLDVTQVQIFKQTRANLADLHIVNGPSVNQQPGATQQQYSGIVNKYNGTFEIQSNIISQKQVGQWWEGTESHELVIMPMEQRIRALAML
jgi:hypothetical protein